MALNFEKFPVIFDLYGISEKGDKTYFPPLGVAFLGEKDNGEAKLSVNLNLLQDTKILGSIRKPRQQSNEPSF